MKTVGIRFKAKKTHYIGISVHHVSTKTCLWVACIQESELIISKVRLVSSCPFFAYWLALKPLLVASLASHVPSYDSCPINYRTALTFKLRPCLLCLPSALPLSLTSFGLICLPFSKFIAPWPVFVWAPLSFIFNWWHMVFHCHLLACILLPSESQLQNFSSLKGPRDIRFCTEDLLALDHCNIYLIKQCEIVAIFQGPRFFFFIGFVILWQLLNRVCLGSGNELPGCGPGTTECNQVYFTQDLYSKAASASDKTDQGKTCLSVYFSFPNW